jgi:hypothetical protein
MAKSCCASASPSRDFAAQISGSPEAHHLIVVPIAVGSQADVQRVAPDSNILTFTRRQTDVSGAAFEVFTAHNRTKISSWEARIIP